MSAVGDMVYSKKYVKQFILYSDRVTITTHLSALFKTCRVPQFSLLAIKSVLNLISTIVKIVEKYDTTLVKHILHYKMQ